MMKAVGFSLLLAIANCEVRLSTQRLNPLVEDSLGFESILLIRRNGGSGGGSLRCSLWRRLSRGRVRWFARLRPGRAHQNQNREKLFHSKCGSNRVQSEL